MATVRIKLMTKELEDRRCSALSVMNVANRLKATLVHAHESEVRTRGGAWPEQKCPWKRLDTPDYSFPLLMRSNITRTKGKCLFQTFQLSKSPVLS